MIPDIDPGLIENSGEQRFYEAACGLPAAYSVYYSYKFSAGEHAENPALIYEADFIIVHPHLGYLVVEVKEGQYQYFNNRWQKQLGSKYVDLDKDPAVQAERAMYSVLTKYKKESGKKAFPLKIKYAVCFPDCLHLSGTTPDNLKPESIWLSPHLDNLDQSIRAVFGDSGKEPEDEAVRILKKILAPSFKVFSTLEAQMEIYYQSSEKVLTEEQERILDETEYDRRKIFFGAAGSGKTFIALEKARRLVRDGKKVLLTCYNSNLADLLRRELKQELESGMLVATNFHDLLMKLVIEKEGGIKVPDGPEARSIFFAEELPDRGFNIISGLEQAEKYDALVIDEGQDFLEEWFIVLQGLLRDGEVGDCYIFADPGQSIFNPQSQSLSGFAVSRHRLTRNLRNTGAINRWLMELLPEAKLKETHRGGMPVCFFEWGNPEEELRLVTRELGRLVSQKVQPRRVTVLSPHVMEKGAFAGKDKLGEWALCDVSRGQKAKVSSNSVSFCTIRSFKGLEADVVFLTGVKTGSRVCTVNDLYVGCSRARFLLYIFHEAGYKFG